MMGYIVFMAMLLPKRMICRMFGHDMPDIWYDTFISATISTVNPHGIKKEFGDSADLETQIRNCNRCNMPEFRTRCE